METIGPDEVLVIEAREQDGAGTIGDILAMRACQRGAAGIVTDGCVRDSPSFARTDMPVYAPAPHAATLGRLHLPLDTNVPIACAGVLVMPGDLVVGDDEGAWFCRRLWPRRWPGVPSCRRSRRRSRSSA